MQTLMRSYLALVLVAASAAVAQEYENESVIQSDLVSFKLEYVIAEDAGLKQPWSMAFLPDGSFLVADKIGKLWLARGGELLDEPIAGLPEIFVLGQSGLLDLELHPQYEENGWIYISYTEEHPEKERHAMTKLVRARLNAAKTALVDMETVFEVTNPNHFFRGGRHVGSRTVFDHDGFLYIAYGDRGREQSSQNMSNVNGHTLRLHEDGCLPADNPFAGRDDVFPGTWSTGHRNPQGMAVHPKTGEVWSIEHGPRGGDELNLIGKGLNYGWPVITYGVNYNNTPVSDKTEMEGMEQPVKYWVPSPAPCGMDIYSGNLFPEWKHNFLIANLRSQKLIRLELNVDNEVVAEEDLLKNFGRLRDVETGPDGAVWILAEQPGRIIRLVPAE